MIRKPEFWYTLAIVTLLFASIIALRWSMDPERGAPAVERVGPDVTAVATASVEQMRRMARLTVLTSTLRADATARVSRYGLSAEILSLARAEARLGVNLAGLRPDAMKFDGKTLTLTIPRSLLTVERGPLTDVRHVDMGGWLLASRGVRAELELANGRALQAELDKQASALRPLAEVQVVATLKAMLELPLRSVGSAAVVAVRVG